MPTLMQKIRLVFRGWQRRREENDKQFLAKNASWGATASAPPVPVAAKARAFAIDTEGLTVAYLDDSGQLAHFLDTEDGDIVDVRMSELASRVELRPPRYRRVPSRSEKSEIEDRRAFIESLDASPARDALARSADADSFRRALASNRTIERAWYNFRNDRAIAVIEAWLEEV
jgi:vacuolar-type H+-ATPase subunit I/STV1